MPDRGEIRSLTTLRGVAALMVAIFHTPALFGAKALLPHAYLAVDFFFVLSGFVLTHAYAGPISEGLGFWRFTGLRLARLYPLYALATLLGAGLLGLRVAAHALPAYGRGWVDLPLGLVFAPSPASPINPEGAAYPFVKQGWSVAWELAGGAALFLWAQGGLRRELAMFAAALAILLAVVWRRISLDGGWVDDSFWIGGVRALYGFSAGVATRRILLPWLARASGRQRFGLNGAALIAGVGAVAYVAGAPTSLLAELALVIYVFPLLIAACALGRHRVLEAPLGVAVGHASYSIYMLHVAAGLATAMALARLPHAPALVMHLFGPAWMAVLVGASWLSWRWIEEPARAALTRRPARRRALRSALRSAFA